MKRVARSGRRRRSGARRARRARLGAPPGDAASFRFERTAVLAGARAAAPRGRRAAARRLRARFGSRAGPDRRAAGRAASRAEGLRDLRFYDVAGREVPYLLVRAAARASPSGAVRRACCRSRRRRKTSGFEADLGAVTTRRPDSRSRALRRRSSSGSRLDGSGDRAHWTRLAPEATLFDLPDSRPAPARARVRARAAIATCASPGTTPRARACRYRARASPRLVSSERAPRRGRLDAACAFERRASEPGTSRFRLRLPGPALPIVALRLVRRRREPPPRRDASARRGSPARRRLPSGSARRSLKRAVRDVAGAPTSCGSRSSRRRPRSSSSRSTTATTRRSSSSPSRRSWRSCPSSTWRASRAGRSSRAGAARRSTRRATTSSRPASAPRSRRAAPAPGARLVRGVRRVAGAGRRPLRCRALGPPLDTAAVPLRADRSPTGPPGLVAVPLDAAVLAHSEGRLSGELRGPADRGLRSAGSCRTCSTAGRSRSSIPLAARRARRRRRPRRFPAATSVYRLTLPVRRAAPGAARAPHERSRLRARGAAARRAACRRAAQAKGDAPRLRRRRRPGVTPTPDSAAPRAARSSLPTLPRRRAAARRRRGRQQRVAARRRPSCCCRRGTYGCSGPVPGELRVVYGQRAASAVRATTSRFSRRASSRALPRDGARGRAGARALGNRGLAAARLLGADAGCGLSCCSA